MLQWILAFSLSAPGTNVGGLPPGPAQALGFGANSLASDVPQRWNNPHPPRQKTETASTASSPKMHLPRRKTPAGVATAWEA